MTGGRSLTSTIGRAETGIECKLLVLHVLILDGEELKYSDDEDKNGGER